MKSAFWHRAYDARSLIDLPIVIVIKIRADVRGASSLTLESRLLSNNLGDIIYNRNFRFYDAFAFWFWAFVSFRHNVVILNGFRFPLSFRF